jgi:hypothetical protein
VCACHCCCCRSDGAGDRPSSAPWLPPDTPYHWSAFNKLLLLGMYAPVEEAFQALGEQHTQVAVQQLQDLAHARQVGGKAGGHVIIQTSMKAHAFDQQLGGLPRPLLAATN